MTNPEYSSTEAILTLSRDTTAETLRERLVASGIPVDEYGQGTAKTLKHLLTEVQEGESVITIDTAGNLSRHVNVLWIDVACSLSNGEVYVLTEDRQEFKDGRTKMRHLESSLGEKLKPGEALEDGVRRALIEEIGVSDIDALYQTGSSQDTLVPDTYPGLKSTYTMHKFATVIAESAFKSEGYTEVQPDKTNYYTWRLIHTNATD